MAKTSRSVQVTNALATLTYLSVAIQWLWAIVIVGYPLLKHTPSIFLPSQPTHQSSYVIPSATLPPYIATIVTIVVVVLMALVTAYVLFTIPGRIAKAGARANKRAVGYIAPTIPTHAKSQRARLMLELKLTPLVKLMAIIIPMAIVLVPLTYPLEHRVVLAVGGFCMCWSLLYLGLQLLVARIFHIPRKYLW